MIIVWCFWFPLSLGLEKYFLRTQFGWYDFFYGRWCNIIEILLVTGIENVERFVECWNSCMKTDDVGTMWCVLIGRSMYDIIGTLANGSRVGKYFFNPIWLTLIASVYALYINRQEFWKVTYLYSKNSIQINS